MTINLEDFKKIDLRVAKILAAEPVEGSDKLVKLKVDLGSERRQILAGIARNYQADELIGRQIVVVANLAPRTVMSQESQGMILAADDGQPALIVPEKEVKPGAKIN